MIKKLIVLLAVIVLVNGHSYPNCIKLVGEDRNGDCVGFIQGFPTRNIYGLGFDGELTNQFSNEQSKLCKWTHGHYENENPTWGNRAQATPGETLTMRYNDFGHHPGGAYPGPSNFSLYWNKNDRNLDFNTLTAGNFFTKNGNKWTHDAKRTNLLFPNPPTQNFLDPTCETQRVPCLRQFTIPRDTAPGVYYFLWFWDLEGYTVQDRSNIYTACFDVEVVSSHPTDKGAAFDGRAIQLTAQLNGKTVYVTVQGERLATSETGGEPSFFTPSLLGSSLIGLQSQFNKRYLAAESSGAAIVNRGGVAGWEKFFIGQRSDGTFTLRSVAHGSYLTVNNDGSVSFTLPEKLSAANYFRVPGFGAPQPQPQPQPDPQPQPQPEPEPQPEEDNDEESGDLVPPETVAARLQGTVTLTFATSARATGYRIHIRQVVDGKRQKGTYHNFPSSICNGNTCTATLSTDLTTPHFYYSVAATVGNTVSAYSKQTKFPQ